MKKKTKNFMFWFAVVLSILGVSAIILLALKASEII